MAAYQHDLTFASLKNVKERVKTNYTSSQFLKTLDHFLWLALEPILRCCPKLAMNFFSKVVAQQAVRSNKMTSDDKADLPVAFINTLLARDKVAAAKGMHINRGILFALISIFESFTRSYRELSEAPPAQSPTEHAARYSQLIRIEKSLDVKPGANLYAAIVGVNHWSREAASFKNVIVEKYILSTLNAAQRTYVDVKYKKPLGEIIMIFLITLSKAIDRCDSRLGVLTTFIQNWLKGARSKVMRDVQMENSESSYEQLVDEAGEDNFNAQHGASAFDESYEASEYLSYIAKRIDPKGCVRASLGIKEHVTRQQYNLLRMLKDNKYEHHG